MDLPTNLTLLLVATAAVAAVTGLWLALRSRRRRTGGKVRVVGIGEGGANAVEAMIRARMKDVDFVVLNTDTRALARSSARTRVAMGKGITNGHGAGGDVSMGEAAARDAADEIGSALEGSQLVVLTAGLGGGTGSGALPVVAEIARNLGALTIAVVTKPFAFEGARRRYAAEHAAKALTTKVDAVATIPNDRVREVMPTDVTVEDAFHSIDDVMQRSVGEMLELIAAPGRINLDFADVRAVLRDGGSAAVGFGRASGENRAVEAARKAVAATHLEGRMSAASSVLVNVSGSRKLKLAELDAVTETVMNAAGRNANLVFGMSLSPRMRDDVQVTLIATGFEGTPQGTDEAPAARAAGGQADADADAAAAEAWRPVWLRRADESVPARRTPPSQRSRRGRGPSAPEHTTPEGTPAD
jgi:cell division protein FtsZ